MTLLRILESRGSRRALILALVSAFCAVLGTAQAAMANPSTAAGGRPPPTIRMAPKAKAEEVIQPGVGVERRPAAEAATDEDKAAAAQTDPARGAGGGAQAPADAKKGEDRKAGRPVSAAPAPVTRVVGEVGENIVTSREVQINDVIEQVVFGRLPGQTQIRVLKGNERSFPSDVQTALREWVIYLEAKSFGSEQVSRADVADAIRLVQEGTARSPAWAALEASPSEISEIVERKLVAKKFLRLKLESAQVPITDDEALAYFKKNRLKFGNLPFSTFRENIKTFLIKQQMDRRLQEWIEVLERRYKVRNFIAG